MASFPGATLEAFVEDVLCRPSAELVAAVVAILSPWREEIEIELDRFEEEEHSWRDYRNVMWRTWVWEQPGATEAVDKAHCVHPFGV